MTVYNILMGAAIACIVIAIVLVLWAVARTAAFDRKMNAAYPPKEEKPK